MSSPLASAKLGQLSMNVTDLTRATDYYRDVLGLPFLFEVPKMSFFDLDGTRLMLASPEGPGTAASTSPIGSPPSVHSAAPGRES